MNIFVTLSVLLAAGICQADPSSHGFTVNAPGQVSTASFGEGAGLSNQQSYRGQATGNRLYSREQPERRPYVQQRRTDFQYQQPSAPTYYGGQQARGGYQASRGGYQGSRGGYQAPRNNYFANPTIRDAPPRYQYKAPQTRVRDTASSGYTVNAPGFTKHKNFKGASVHGTNQAFLHASSGVQSHQG